MVRQQMFAFGVAVAMGAAVSGTSQAGWGSLGSYGSYGSSSSSYGSSGGGSYGSSGGSYGSHGSKYYSSVSYSYGSYGSSGGYAGGSSGGSSGGWSTVGSHGSSGGSVRSGRRGGLLARLFGHHRSRRASSGGSYGSYSAYGSSGGSYGSSGSSYGSSGGSYGSSHAYYRSSYGSSSHGSSGQVHGGSSGVSTYYGGYGSGQPIYDSYQGDVYDEGMYYEDGGATQQAPEADSAPAEGGTDVEARVSDDTAILTVAVPAEARVFVNDEATQSEGPVRQYISHGLRAGYSYTYVVRVEQMVDGEKITDVKEVRLRAGSTERLVFDLPEADEKVASNPAETVLTLVVPEDAQVTLAGNPTKVTGNVRTYRTTQLSPGQQWDNYTVRVTVNRDGRELSKEQTISLRGGSEEKLAFEFSDTELASR